MDTIQFGSKERSRMNFLGMIITGPDPENFISIRLVGMKPEQM